MKMFKIVSFLLLILVLISGCGTTPSNENDNTKDNQNDKEVKLVVGHTGNKDNSVDIFFEKLKEEIEESSNNNIQLEIQGAGALGGDEELIESVNIGSVDMISAASSNMAPYTEEILALDLPYIFKSRDDANNILKGEIGEGLLNEVSETTGNKALTFINVGGFRLLANTKKEIKTPNDSKGLKLRATGSPIEESYIKNIGANPTPISWSETYNSVEQKVVDGLQLQPNWLALNGFDEIMNYATETQALMAFHVVQFNQEKWDELTEDQRSIITESIDKVRDEANEADAKDEDNFKKDLIDNGVDIYTPSDSELEEWSKLGKEVREEQIDKNNIDKSLVEDILSEQN
ncbi:MAG TPA: TRAP transporter substrate-binding protein [Pseudogracilibacillus sp.]|nr:TRAP transporter substrate-binding protein [Pseudogracilibacillus sp.]